MLPDAVKNPLIYLNFALYCYEIGKPDQSVLYLANFLEMTQHITVHREVSKGEPWQPFFHFILLLMGLRRLLCVLMSYCVLLSRCTFCSISKWLTD